MLRSLLVGVLALSTASACKGKSDAPAVQPGVAVGKVVELKGEVSATRGTEKRALTAGQEISGDDTIETGDGANVRILFAHNNATWELGPKRTQLVSESLAWKLPKQSGSAATVDEATLAAGRHAERETVTTTTTAPAPGAPAPAMADPAPPPSEPDLQPKGGEGGGGAPPVTGGKLDQPPKMGSRRRNAEPPTTKESAAANAQGDVDERAPAKAAAPRNESAQLDDEKSPPSPPPPPPPPKPADVAKAKATDEVRQTIGTHKAELAACMDSDKVSFDVVVVKGKAKFVFAAGTSAKAKTCFSAIAAKLSFPADYDLTTNMSFKK